MISANNVSLRFGKKALFEEVNITFSPGNCYGLIGANGAGKSTFLKILSGQLETTTGDITMDPGERLSILEQDHFKYDEYNVMDTVIMGNKRLYEVMKEKDAIYMKEDFSEEDGIRASELEGEFAEMDGWNAESDAASLLNGLGVDTEFHYAPMAGLDDNLKVKVLLAQALFGNPDNLLLDEPTNHLDLDAIAWLEDFLIDFENTVIVVSHDRYFIDRVSSQILEIEHGKSTLYRGNYSFYREQYEKKRQDEMKAYLNQQAEIAHEEDVIRKLKSFNREKSIKRAESREKLLAKVDRIEKPEELKTDMRLTLTPVTESGEDVLFAEHLKKAYGDNLLFQELGLDIKRGEHVALIGGNGTGKTTLLKILARKLAKDGGVVTLGARVRMGYFDQENQDLDPEKTLFDEMSDAFPEMTNTRIRNVLAAFLFTGEKVFQKIGDLSGGERGRLSLAKLMLSPANLLLLDEPTNHLDIRSKEILEDAIRDYTGTVLYVSHDRYFINQTATRILELRHKVLTNYPGNYDEYEENREKLFQLQNAENPYVDTNQTMTRDGFSIVSTDAYARETGGGGKEEYLQRKEAYAAERKRASDLRKLEKQIAAAEEELDEIGREMNLPENGTNVELLTKLTGRQEELEEQLLEWYEAVEELT